MSEFLDKRWPFCLYLDHLRLPLSLKGTRHSGSHGTQLKQQCLAIFVFHLPIMDHFSYGTTPATNARGCNCPTIQVDEWFWLVKSVALSPGLLVSGSNWHGSRQTRLSHVVGHDWPEEDGGRQYEGLVSPGVPVSWLDPLALQPASLPACHHWPETRGQTGIIIQAWNLTSARFTFPEPVQIKQFFTVHF